MEMEKAERSVDLSAFYFLMDSICAMVAGPSVEIRKHFSFRWEEKLLCGSVEPSPATLIRVAFIFSNLAIEKLKPKEQMLFRF